VPVVTVGVLVLAVGAGVLAGVKGTPARYSGRPAPRTPSAAAPSPAPRTSAPETGPLPATIGGETGGSPAVRLARGGATWPDTTALTLRLGAGHGGARVSVVVTCPSGPRLLAFTAYVVGDAGSLVRGTCAAVGGGPPVSRSLRLPAGAGPARIRVRVRPGAGAGDGPISWFAGLSGAAS
jgi:hypothetical protein